MLRSLLLALASRAKTEGAIDFALRYNPLVRKRVMKALSHSPGYSSEALLSGILKAARKTPYGTGRNEALNDWPVLTKDMLHDTPSLFLNPHTLLRVPASTGGTTGTPLKLWRTLECISAEQAFLDSLLAPCGLSMRSKMAVLRADTIKPANETTPPYGRISHGGERLVLSSNHLNSDTLLWYVDAIARFAPSILWVYPSAALNLFTLMRRSGQRLSIPVILASSEMLNANSHAALAEFFDSTLINYYGQAERACLAWSTNPGEFYFHPTYGHVELIAATEENTFRVVATGYWNKAMPLVRYDTGDLIRADEKNLQAVARGEAPFMEVIGRDGEYLLTRESMRIIGLNHIPREVRHIAQVQLVQADYDTLLVRVIALPGFSDTDTQQLREQAQAKLPGSMRARVEVVPSLAHTPRGKTPFVIRAIR